MDSRARSRSVVSSSRLRAISSSPSFVRPFASAESWGMRGSLGRARGSTLQRGGEPIEQARDGGTPVLLEEACPGAGEVGVLDGGLGDRLEAFASPREPTVPLLVEDEQRLVAELRELGAPASAALDRFVRQ